MQLVTKNTPFLCRRPLEPVKAMPKARYKHVNPLVDDHRSLEEIFEQAKMKHYTGTDPDNKGQRETKDEKKLRIKKEQVKKHNEHLKIERKKCK